MTATALSMATSGRDEVAVASPGLTPDAARVLTDEVKADAAALWAKLLQLYEGGAHAALGYSSWADYCAVEFEVGRTRSYQLLDAARVVGALQSTNVDSAPPTEGVARHLVPVLREDPNAVAEVWGEVVTEHGPKPTANQVRSTVQRLRNEEEAVATLAPLNGRDEVRAHAHKRKIIDLASALSGFARGVDGIDVDRARAVMDEVELREWDRLLADSLSKLRQFRSELQKGRT